MAFSSESFWVQFHDLKSCPTRILVSLTMWIHATMLCCLALLFWCSLPVFHQRQTLLSSRDSVLDMWWQAATKLETSRHASPLWVNTFAWLTNGLCFQLAIKFCCKCIEGVWFFIAISPKMSPFIEVPEKDRHVWMKLNFVPMAKMANGIQLQQKQGRKGQAVTFLTRHFVWWWVNCKCMVMVSSWHLAVRSACGLDLSFSTWSTGLALQCDSLMCCFIIKKCFCCVFNLPLICPLIERITSYVRKQKRRKWTTCGAGKRQRKSTDKCFEQSRHRPEVLFFQLCQK